MEDKNKRLLEDVIEERLTRTRIGEPGNEDDRVAFKEAMDALSKQIEFDKIEASHSEQLEKLRIENERLKAERDKNHRDEAARKKEVWIDAGIKIGTFLGGTLLGAWVEHKFKMTYMRDVCQFEKDNTFISTPGRGLSSLFHFKK